MVGKKSGKALLREEGMYSPRPDDGLPICGFLSFDIPFH